MDDQGSGFGIPRNESQTLASFPPIKLLEIFQKMWSDDSTTSEMFFTMLCIDCQTGSAGDLAEENFMIR